MQKWLNQLRCCFVGQIRVGPRHHILDGVHIDATWRIRLNDPCMAVMRPSQVTDDCLWQCGCMHSVRMRPVVTNVKWSLLVTTVLQKQRNRLKCCLGCRVGARNHVLGGGPNPPRGTGNYRGRLPLHYKAILVAWVKTARSSMANDTVTE